MRVDRLILILAFGFFIGCKATQTTQAVPKYEEDLSILRPVFEAKDVSEAVRNEEVVIPSGHIKNELDSISKIIIVENAKPRTEQGYTIQIYSGTNREEATKALGKIRVSFPEIDAHLTYFQPDFKVKAGKFTDRIMAYEVFEKMKVEFADALLIPEKIKFNDE